MREITLFYKMLVMFLPSCYITKLSTASTNIFNLLYCFIPCFLNYYIFVVTLLRVVDSFSPSFLVYYPYIFIFCWMVNGFSPSFLIYNIFIFINSLMMLILSIMMNSFIPSFLIYYPFRMTQLRFHRNLLSPSFLINYRFHMSLFFMLDSFFPSLLNQLVFPMTFLIMNLVFYPRFFIRHPNISVFFLNRSICISGSNITHC